MVETLAADWNLGRLWLPDRQDLQRQEPQAGFAVGKTEETS